MSFIYAMGCNTSDTDQGADTSSNDAALPPLDGRVHIDSNPSDEVNSDRSSGADVRDVTGTNPTDTSLGAAQTSGDSSSAQNQDSGDEADDTRDTTEDGSIDDEGSNDASSTSAPDDSSSDAEPDDGCVAFEPFDVGLVATREVFVDANASQSGDGSAQNPFTDLEAAFAILEPGTALRIMPGTYTGGLFVSNAHGTAENPIWIGGIPGQPRPIIEGGSNALQLSPASYVIVHDLELSAQESNGLNVDDGEVGSEASHHLIFRHLLVHELGDGGNQDCLKLSGVSDHFVLDNEFRGCSGGSAVDHVGCHRGVIARNRFIDLTGNGVQSKGGSDDILITQNHFLNAGERAVNMGGSTGFEFFRPPLSSDDVNYEASDIRVISNLFRGGTSPVAFVGCVDCLAANNTIIDPERWVVRVLQETVSTEAYEFAPAQRGRFLNNLIYYSAALLSTHVNVGPDTSSETFEFANNLWYAYDDVETSAPESLPVAESGGVYGADPAFADLVSDDVSIGTSSPAAHAGVAIAEVVADLDGECFSSQPSIGAREEP